jgi:hypothetical protein
MSGLTLTGMPALDRRPALPAPLDMEHLLDLAILAKRSPGDLSSTELWQLGEGVEVQESNLLDERRQRMLLTDRLDAIEEERDVLQQELAVARAAIRLLTEQLQGTRIVASFERLTVTVTGRSYAAVGERLAATAHRASGFDLSDCDDTVVVDAGADR